MSSMWPYPLPVERYPQYRNVFHEVRVIKKKTKTKKNKYIKGIQYILCTMKYFGAL